MLSVSRRIHANKLHAALSAVFCRISAGSLLGRPLAYSHVALLTAQEEWQAKTYQDARAPAVGLRQAARQSAPGHPSLQLPEQAPVGNQPAEGLCHWRD